jgi:ATP-dependent helicase/DNAse subunit B
MAKSRLTVSQSKIKTYRKCHYAYYLSYVEKIRRKQVSRPFQFGGIVHEMLAAEANADDPFEILDQISLDNHKLFTAEKEMYGEIIEDIRTIMSEYFNYYRNDEFIYYRRSKQSAEFELTVEIADGIDLICIIDTIAETQNRLIWLVEHKTFNYRWSIDEQWRNLQAAIYLKALQIAQWPSVDGICWNFIRSKAPTKPQWLKSGVLSKKRIDSLPSVVYAVIKQNGLNVKDYQSLIASTAQNVKNYFYRVYTPISQKVIDAIYTDFVATAIEIKDTHGRKKDKNIDRHCAWCDFEPICRAEMEGSDTNMIRKGQYEKKDESASKKRGSKERSGNQKNSKATRKKTK